jgi:DNA-binding NarL/FixJ family response regulator
MHHVSEHQRHFRTRPVDLVSGMSEANLVISRGIATGCSIRSIAASLDRAPSTISREIKRNGDQRSYRAS